MDDENGHKLTSTFAIIDEINNETTDKHQDTNIMQELDTINDNASNADNRTSCETGNTTNTDTARKSSDNATSDAIGDVFCKTIPPACWTNCQ